jgi:thioredoxin reductase
VIFALGGHNAYQLPAHTGHYLPRRRPVFDETGATNVDGLYLIGDLVVGKKGGSIITAFNSAVRAMKSIRVDQLDLSRKTGLMVRASTRNSGQTLW